MREFFKQILIDFYIYAGTRPMDKMSDDEVQKLLDALCSVSKMYSYISETDQKQIISSCLVSDKEYVNINARLLHKWLGENGKKYFKEEAHKETAIHEPAPPEVAQKYMEEFKRNLEKIGEPENIFKPEKIKELHQSETLLNYYKDKTKFFIEGVEVWAKTEEEARNIYLLNQ